MASAIESVLPPSDAGTVSKTHKDCAKVHTGTNAQTIIKSFLILLVSSYGYNRGIVERSDKEYAIHDIVMTASPGKVAEILLVVELHHLAAAPHERVGGYATLLYGEIEFVGLYGTASLRSGKSGQDEAAFIGFPYISLVNQLVKRTGLDSFAEDIIEMEPEITGTCKQKNQYGPENDLPFFHNLNHSVSANIGKNVYLLNDRLETEKTLVSKSSIKKVSFFGDGKHLFVLSNSGGEIIK